MNPFPLELHSLHEPTTASIPTEDVEIDGRPISILYERSERAKRYLLRIDRDGRVRATIPRRGSMRQAQQFVKTRHGWLAENLRRFSALPKPGAPWQAGQKIYFRGRLTPIELHPRATGTVLRLGEEFELFLQPELSIPSNLRSWLEGSLRRRADPELRARTLELAALHGVPIDAICVRSQTSRWGSCSSTGTLSLNWRLIQTPIAVRDYVILHELMHRRELNHSPKFWALVARACPDYEACERWLKEHGLRIL